MNSINTTSDTPVIELKGSVMTVIVLHLKATDTGRLYPQLEQKIGKAQAFFRSAPVLIDLSDLGEAEQLALDFIELVAKLRDLGVVPVGVRGNALSQNKRILQAGLGLLPAVKAEKSVVAAEEVSPPLAESSPIEETKPTAILPSQTLSSIPTKTISQPVRSGQQIFAPQGDLVILSSVNAGAEVLAAGNIHIYGALRGRALAGINGDTTARIFSLQCNPELVAIAGEYVVNESLEPSCINQCVLVSLHDNGLQFDITGTFTPAV